MKNSEGRGTMDYLKLSESSLDEIMREIRNRNCIESAAPAISNHAERTTDNQYFLELKMVDENLAQAGVGRQIGQKKSPMYRKKGLVRKFARAVEKIYLRIAELTNRDIREFNGILITTLQLLKKILVGLISGQDALRGRLDEQDALIHKLKEENNQMYQKLQIFESGLVQKLNQMEQSFFFALEECKTETDKQKQDLEQFLSSSERQKQDLEQFLSNSERQDQMLEQLLSDLEDQRKNLDMLLSNVEEHKRTQEKMQACQEELRGNLNGQQEKVSSLRDELYHQLSEEQQQAFFKLIERLNQQEAHIRDTSEKLMHVRATIQWRNQGTTQTGSASVVGSEKPTGLDSVFYHDFEEQFRGTQEDIRDRLTIYIPLFQRHFGDLSKKSFVDIGCGRGEMLDLWKENGVGQYMGVDINGIQLELCRQNGHPVKEQECIGYLQELEAESVDLITGIQLIEHLPLEALLILLQECRRVLKPDGMILFETPNSANIVTASSYFYVDPTHIRPLHKDMIRFLAERSGFRDVQIIEANPVRYTQTLMHPVCLDGNQQVWDTNVDMLNRLLYGPQDYSVVGVK